MSEPTTEELAQFLRYAWHQPIKMRQSVARLEAQEHALKLAQAALEEVEWRPDAGAPSGASCPYCGHDRQYGHEDCPRQQALAAIKETEPGLTEEEQEAIREDGWPAAEVILEEAGQVSEHETIKQLKEELENAIEMQRQASASATHALALARTENAHLCLLLQRLRSWDVIASGEGDGPYWTREIDAALNGECKHERWVTVVEPAFDGRTDKWLVTAPDDTGMMFAFYGKYVFCAACGKSAADITTP